MSRKAPQAGTQGGERGGWPWWAALTLLLVVTAVAYAPVTGYPFVNYDDPDYVVENPQVLQGLTAESLAWAWSTGHASNWHPVTWWSHLLDVQLFGLDAGAHHRTNLGLHLLNTLLTALVLTGLTGRRWPSLAVAALFALHPTHVESVAWVSERKDLLSTFFFWLTLAAYGAWARRPDGASGPLRYSLVVVTLALGLASKPMLVTVPFVLLLLDAWPLGRLGLEPGLRPRTRRARVRARVVEKLPLFALAAVSSGVTLAVQRAGGAVSSIEGLAIGERLGNALAAYLGYLGKLVWPLKLAVLYPFPQERSWLLPAAALALLVALSWLAVAAARKNPRLIFLPVGWLWFLGTLVPVIGLVQVGVQAMADRYTYLPYTGLFLILAFGALEIARWVPVRVSGVVLLALLVLLGLRTRGQVAVWGGSVALFSHALEVTGPNPHMQNLLGITLVTGKLLEPELRPAPGQALSQDLVEEGVAHLQEAVRLKPDFATAHNNLGIAAQRRGRPAEAEAHFRRALEPLSSSGRRAAEVLNNLGNVLAEQRRLEPALEAYRLARRADPSYPQAQHNLGRALAEEGRLEEARAPLEAAVELAPDQPSPRADLARVLVSSGRFSEAEESYRIALAATDAAGRADLRRELGDLLALQGRFAAAADEYRAVVEIRPQDSAARFLLAVAALETHDRRSAEEQAAILDDLDPQAATRLRQLLAGGSAP